MIDPDESMKTKELSFYSDELMKGNGLGQILGVRWEHQIPDFKFPWVLLPKFAMAGMSGDFQMECVGSSHRFSPVADTGIGLDQNQKSGSCCYRTPRALRAGGLPQCRRG